MSISPYKIFSNWLFDGSLKSPIPEPKSDDDGNVIIPDLLKYNSPITHTFLIRMFLRNGPMNHYLNEYFNNMNLRYLTRKELFEFIKKAVIDFRVNKRDVTYFPYRHKDKLLEKLRGKLPILKIDDVSLLGDLIVKSSEKDSIYSALGLEKPKKTKTRKQKNKKTNVKDFMEEHFSIVD